MLKIANANRVKAATGRKGFNMLSSRRTMSPSPDDINPLDLIRLEIAIMKKLDHPNVVSLIEVLDDPSDDLLYMVLEMCKKGVVMHVGLDERADPYDNERCRLWFRDMILGLEYRKSLHIDLQIYRNRW
jgi:calcium/calmodulin-dependent protein kinase kinase 2